MTKPTGAAIPATPATPTSTTGNARDGYTFYRDTLDDTLLRIGPDGIPDVLWPDGTWHAYPDADLATEMTPLNGDGAATLAAGADLNSPRISGTASSPQPQAPA